MMAPPQAAPPSVAPTEVDADAATAGLLAGPALPPGGSAGFAPETLDVAIIRAQGERQEQIIAAARQAS